LTANPSCAVPDLLDEGVHLDDDDILSATDVRPPAGGDLGAALVGGHYEGVLVRTPTRLNVPEHHGPVGLSSIASSAKRKSPHCHIAETIYLFLLSTCPTVNV